MGGHIWGKCRCMETPVWYWGHSKNTLPILGHLYLPYIFIYKMQYISPFCITLQWMKTERWMIFLGVNDFHISHRYLLINRACLVDVTGQRSAEPLTGGRPQTVSSPWNNVVWGYRMRSRKIGFTLGLFSHNRIFKVYTHQCTKFWLAMAVIWTRNMPNLALTLALLLLVVVASTRAQTNDGSSSTEDMAPIKAGLEPFYALTQDFLDLIRSADTWLGDVAAFDYLLGKFFFGNFSWTLTFMCCIYIIHIVSSCVTPSACLIKMQHVCQICDKKYNLWWWLCALFIWYQYPLNTLVLVILPTLVSRSDYVCSGLCKRR